MSLSILTDVETIFPPRCLDSVLVSDFGTMPENSREGTDLLGQAQYSTGTGLFDSEMGRRNDDMLLSIRLGLLTILSLCYFEKC